MIFLIYIFLCLRGHGGIGSFFKVLLGLVFLVLDVVLILLIIFLISLFA